MYFIIYLKYFFISVYSKGCISEIILFFVCRNLSTNLFKNKKEITNLYRMLYIGGDFVIILEEKSKTEKYYTCKYDRPFKEIMLNENNKDILKELLVLILKVNINEIEVKNVERNTRNLKKKYVRPRNMAYISNMYANHTLIGNEYDEHTLILQINLSYGLEKKKWNNVSSRMYQMQDIYGDKYVKNLKIYEINMDYYLDLWYNQDEKAIEKNKYLIID